MLISRYIILYSLFFILVLLIGCKSNDNRVGNSGNLTGDSNNTDENMSCTNTENCWNVYYDSDTPIGGFQFNLTGVVLEEYACSGGASADAGFSVSNGSSKVLGFSLTGATIPAGEGVLVVLDVEGNTVDACLSGVIISDSDGVGIDVTIENCIIHIP